MSTLGQEALARHQRIDAALTVLDNANAAETAAFEARRDVSELQEASWRARDALLLTAGWERAEGRRWHNPLTRKTLDADDAAESVIALARTFRAVTQGPPKGTP